MPKTILILCAGLLLVCVFAAGCGGDGENGNGSGNPSAANGAATDEPGAGGDDAGGGATDGGASIEKEEFVERANAICKQTSRKLLMAFSQAFQDVENVDFNETNIKLMKTTVVPTLKEETAAIRALGVPSGDESEVEAYLDGAMVMIARAERNPLRFARNNFQFTEAEEAARKYGITGCPVSPVIEN